MQRDQGTTSHKVLHTKCTSFTSKKPSSCFQMILRKVVKGNYNLLKVMN